MSKWCDECLNVCYFRLDCVCFFPSFISFSIFSLSCDERTERTHTNCVCELWIWTKYRKLNAYLESFKRIRSLEHELLKFKVQRRIFCDFFFLFSTLLLLRHFLSFHTYSVLDVAQVGTWSFGASMDVWRKKSEIIMERTKQYDRNETKLSLCQMHHIVGR